MKRDLTPLLSALSQVDWPRAIHRASALVRALRGDGEQSAADEGRERERAGQLRSTINAVARHAVGCSGRPDCTCPICEEGRP